MWLYLDLAGIEFHFRVNNYRKSTLDNWDVEWCNVDVTIHSGNWLNYQISSEILLACEVEEIRDKISDLLEDRIQEQIEIEFIEPDLSLFLNPKEDIRDNPRVYMLLPGMKL